MSLWEYSLIFRRLEGGGSERTTSSRLKIRLVGIRSYISSLMKGLFPEFCKLNDRLSPLCVTELYSYS